MAEENRTAPVNTERTADCLCVRSAPGRTDELEAVSRAWKARNDWPTLAPCDRKREIIRLLVGQRVDLYLNSAPFHAEIHVMAEELLRAEEAGQPVAPARIQRAWRLRNLR